MAEQVPYTFSIEDVNNILSEPLRRYTYMASFSRNLDNPTFDIDPLYIEGIEFSYPDVGVETINFQSTHFHLADRRNVRECTVTFFEDDECRVQQFLSQWRGQIYNEDTGVYAYPREYKRDIVISVLDVEHFLIGTVTIQGAFPSNSVPVAFGAGRTERVQIIQQFSVDRVKLFPEFPVGGFSDSNTLTTS